MLDILRSLFISFFAVAVLLPVIRYATRRLSPPSKAGTPLTAEELKYMQKRDWRLMWAYFFFACVLAVFSAGTLAIISSIIHSSISGYIYMLTPNFEALFAPGLLIGLTMALLPVRLVQQTLLGYDHDMYKEYLQQSEGRNSIKVYRILFIVMLLLSSIVAWFAVQWHVTIDATQVKVTNPFSEERTYAMSDISEIRYLGKEGEYLVTFSDHTTLNTAYLKPVDLEMIALLSEKSGHRLKQ
jgi:ABC-type multidrug transport system fused ATPase/permease subunit